MSENTVKLTNCAAKMRYEHENYKNARLHIVINYEGEWLEDEHRVKIIPSNKDKTLENIKNQLQGVYMFQITEEDCEKIMIQCIKIMGKSRNVANSLTFNGALRELYRYHIDNCKSYHLNEWVDGHEVTYIRSRKMEDTEINYFCIQCRAIQSLLDAVDADMKSLSFKREADVIFTLWSNGSGSHRAEYQNRCEPLEKYWSIRIPMDEEFYRIVEMEAE